MRFIGRQNYWVEYKPYPCLHPSIVVLHNDSFHDRCGAQLQVKEYKPSRKKNAQNEVRTLAKSQRDGMCATAVDRLVEIVRVRGNAKDGPKKRLAKKAMTKTAH